MMNEGFGKKWIDKILGKVDKDQGIANAGKVLGIGSDGIVTPVEQTGGSGSKVIESFESITLEGLRTKLQIGDMFTINLSVKIGTSLVKGSDFALTDIGDAKYITGSFSPNTINKNISLTFTVTNIDESTIYVSHIGTVVHHYSDTTTISNKSIYYTTVTIIDIDKFSTNALNTFYSHIHFEIHSMDGSVITRTKFGGTPNYVDADDTLSGFVIHNS